MIERDRERQRGRQRQEERERERLGYTSINSVISTLVSTGQWSIVLVSSGEREGEKKGGESMVVIVIRQKREKEKEKVKKKKVKKEGKRKWFDW